jgi:hypothetical protein
MNRRESPKHCPNDDDEVQVLKESQTNRLKVLEGMKKKSAERLLAAKDHKEAKLAEKESRTLEFKFKMMDTYNSLRAADVGLMTDEEKKDHVDTLKYLKNILFNEN